MMGKLSPFGNKHDFPCLHTVSVCIALISTTYAREEFGIDLALLSKTTKEASLGAPSRHVCTCCEPYRWAVVYVVSVRISTYKISRMTDLGGGLLVFRSC